MYQGLGKVIWVKTAAFHLPYVVFFFLVHGFTACLKI